MLKSLIGRLFSRPAAARAQLGESENYFTVGARSWSSEERDRFDYDREEMLKLALEAWRVNPLARRIVELTTQYVVGAGLRIRADHADTHRFIEDWWNDRLNQIPMRAYEWCDELTRSGELFFLVSTDAAGMSYVRGVPAVDIESILTAENDVQQETGYIQRAANPGEEPSTWPAYDPKNDLQAADGSYPTVMLHYAINRPVGAVRGESDLAPLLRWLSRYAAWLEDRARLNRYRNSFLFVVRGRWASETERASRQAALTAVPPSPGSFLVVDESETWEVMSPKLESADANEDGLALKKMIAAGAGLPLHFLAEPESSNKSTAESAGGPTYRHFEQRQEFFTWLVTDLARVCVRRRGQIYRRVRDDVQIQVTGADLSARDNAALAVAMSSGISALIELRDRCIIDDAELLRMAYKFGGEAPDVEAILERGRKAGKRLSSSPDDMQKKPAVEVEKDQPASGGKKASPVAASKVIDQETGDAKGVAAL